MGQENTGLPITKGLIQVSNNLRGQGKAVRSGKSLSLFMFNVVGVADSSSCLWVCLKIIPNAVDFLPLISA